MNARRESRDESPKGGAACECLRHHRPLHAGLLQYANDLAELTDPNPRELGHQVGDLVRGLALVRHGDDLDACRRAASAKSSGKRPLPAIRPMRSGVAGIVVAREPVRPAGQRPRVEAAMNASMRPTSLASGSSVAARARASVSGSFDPKSRR